MAEDTHETKIIISGDANGATNAFNKVIGVLGTVRSAVNRVMQAFGLFGLAVQGVQMLVNGFKKLRDRLTETAREVAKFKWDIEMRNAANETARLVGWHEKLAKLMKDELDTLNKQRSVQGIEAQGRKDYEDGKREADRARQIYEAKTPEEEQRLRDKFAAEDEQREREDRKAQRQERIHQLDDEESVYSSKARSLRERISGYDRQIEVEQFNLKRANGDERLTKEIRERIEKLENGKKSDAETLAQYEKEAKFRRDQIAALESQQDYEGPTAGEWQRKTEARKREEERQNDEEEDRRRRDEESSRRAAEFVDGYQKDLNADRREQAGELSSFADRLAANDGVSQNRLTAMGLGSGVHGGNGIANDVKRVVKLLEDQISATKDINLTSTFAD